MATTTPNYGWSVPTSTDLVKDGATAIETLGDAIDASLVDLRGGTTGQILKKASNTQMDFEWGSATSGFTLINTTAFTTVASQSLNNVFSATYDNYKIIFDLVCSANGVALNFRCRASAADETSAAYYGGRALVNTGGTVTGSGSSATTSYFLLTSSTGKSYTAMDFNDVSEARWLVSSYNSDTSGFIGGAGALRTAFTPDGFTIFPASGTITGTVSVYGLAK